MRKEEIVGSEADEDYDPFAHRPAGPKTTDIAVFVHLLKSSIGTGILFLPNAFRRTGYVMSIACGVIIGLISTHTAVIMVRSSQTLCKRLHIPMLDFARTAEISVQFGPRRIRNLGKLFGIATNVFVCYVQLQAAVIYTLYVSTSFQQVIEYFSGIELDIRLYILMFFPIMVGLGLAASLNHLVPFSVIGTVFLATGVFITMYYLLKDVPDPGRLDAFTSILPVPMYCSIFLFALHNMTLYLPLENEMKNPAHMPNLVMYSTLLNTVIYTVFGFLGYNKYMLACDTVIKNLPLEEVLAQVVKITISTSVLFTFGLVYYVPIQILWPMIREKLGPDRHHEIYEFLFRLCGVGGISKHLQHQPTNLLLLILIHSYGILWLPALLAIAVPEMVPLLGFLAAFSITTTMLLIPVLIETFTRWKDATKLLLSKNIMLSVLWLLILVFGALESMRSIIREYGGKREEDC